MSGLSQGGVVGVRTWDAVKEAQEGRRERGMARQREGGDRGVCGGYVSEAGVYVVV